MLHPLNRLIGKEPQFGDYPELMALQRTELSADSARVLGDLLHQFFLAIVGEDAQVDIRHTQVGRYTYFAHRNKHVAYLPGIFQEYITQVLLYQTCNLVLSR